MGTLSIWIIALTLVLDAFFVHSAPVVQQKTEDKNGGVKPSDQEDFLDPEWQALEYQRYLQEVISVLESDPEVKKRLEAVDIEDIKSGKVADHLDFAPENIRSKLHEVKRREISRLRDTISKLIEAGEHEKIQVPEHIDHSNLDTFEKEDLQNLIKRTHADLEELDKKRQAEFKEYEIKKEGEYREKLANLTESERQKAEKEHEALKKKHAEHPDVHHPGSKAQLEEVWEKKDNLEKEAFDMRTFFNLHDLDTNGYLDPEELDALLQNELDKVYDPKNAEDDMKERDEEENRMREHIVNEMDKDKDGLISIKEFMMEAEDPEFEKDEGWKTLDEAPPIYTEEEIAAYMREYERINGTPVPRTQPISHQGAGRGQQQAPPQGQDSMPHPGQAIPINAKMDVNAQLPAQQIGGNQVPDAASQNKVNQNQV